MAITDENKLTTELKLSTTNIAFRTQ